MNIRSLLWDIYQEMFQISLESLIYVTFSSLLSMATLRTHANL